jgi:hypothetical protein
LTQALIEWRAGDPIPESLSETLTYANEALEVIKTVTSNQVDRIIAAIQIAINALGQIASNLR